MLDNGIVDVDARLNVAADGKRFRCDFIREGPVFYGDKGIEVLRRATIQSCLQSFIGKPLTIEHIDPRLNVADPEVMKRVAHGVVDAVGFDAETGWFWCQGDVTSDKGREAAGRMSPSCGYNVTEKIGGGRWNNLPYEREPVGIAFHHLALTEKRPRYEEADFRLNAVTDNEGKTMAFKFIKTIAAALAGGAPTVTEVEIPADATIKSATGKEYRLNAVIEAQEAAAIAAETAAAAAAPDARANAITDETEVLVRGKKVKVKDLIAAEDARLNAVAAAETEQSRLNDAGKKDFIKLNAAAAQGAVIRTDYPKTQGGMAEGMKRGTY